MSKSSLTTPKPGPSETVAKRAYTPTVIGKSDLAISPAETTIVDRYEYNESLLKALDGSRDALDKTGTTSAFQFPYAALHADVEKARTAIHKHAEKLGVSATVRFDGEMVKVHAKPRVTRPGSGRKPAE